MNDFFFEDGVLGELGESERKGRISFVEVKRRVGERWTLAHDAVGAELALT